MDLPETFKLIAPGVIGFAQTLLFSGDGSVPLAPRIFATGFVVDRVGIVATNRHVVESFEKFPKHPKTGKAAVAALYCHYGVTENGKDFVRWVPIDMKYSTIVESITSLGVWHGDDEPDIGFVQLMLQDLPALKLAGEESYLKPGMPIATAGYPMGDAPLTVMKKINQMTPFVRRGIVSSVYPFSIGRPHGFTIDIMQQGGSSGSPIFYVDRPEVLGMMSSSLPDVEYDADGAAHWQNTNISICVPGWHIAAALETFKTQYPPKLEDVRPLADHLAAIPMKTSMGWGVFGPSSPGQTP